MSDYIITNGELKHYGVVGMKWGVRKDPSKAYGRASRKLNRLKAREAKKTVKAVKKRAKADKLGARWAGWGWGDVTKASKAAYRAERKQRKATIKAAKWEQHMSKAFKDVKISEISDKDLRVGSNYIYMLIRDQA